MYMLVRYTDEEESAYAAVIRVAGHRQPLQWHVNKFAPGARWNATKTRAEAAREDGDVAYFGIESVKKIEGYTL